MNGPISDLPPGLVREAVAPERLVVVWTGGPVAELLEAAHPPSAWCETIDWKASLDQPPRAG